MFNEVLLYTEQKVQASGAFYGVSLSRRTSPQPNGGAAVQGSKPTGSGTFVDPLFPD